MQTGSRLIVAVCFLLAVTIYVPFTVLGDDEEIDTLAKTKLFTNTEELKEYLDLVKHYFILNGKGRYGKRSGASRDVLGVLKYLSKPLLLKRTILQPAYRNNEAQDFDV